MALAFHVMSQDHVTRGSFDFICSNPSCWAIILPSLAVMATLVVKLQRI